MPVCFVTELGIPCLECFDPENDNFDDVCTFFWGDLTGTSAKSKHQCIPVVNIGSCNVPW